MGYQDREYFRNASYPYLDLIRSTRACWGIVLVYTFACLAVSFTDGTAHPLRQYLRLDPAAVTQGWQWYRVVTGSFVVDNAWHLIFALLLLWLLGHELESRYGSREFLVFFVVCTVLGGMTQTLTYRMTGAVTPPPQLGPATAALAVTLLAALCDPFRVVPFLVLPMQMWVFASLVGVFEAFYFLKGLPWPARFSLHAGTLAFTTLYGLLDWRLVHAWIVRPARQAGARQLASVLSAQPEVLQGKGRVPVSLSPQRPVDEQLEAKMDTVLEKVSKTGMDSLTMEEKNILRRASEALRRKRN